MDGEYAHKINLIEYVLSVEHPGVPEPSELQLKSWTEEQLRAYYRAGTPQLSRIALPDVPGSGSQDQPGGGVAQSADPDAHTRTPPAARANQLAATVAGYRAQALSDGIPFRPHGLFPPADALLGALAAEGARPFEKHLAGEISSYELLPLGSWTSGDAAARAGFDMRLFYKASAGTQRYGTVAGAARLGDAASIGNGLWMTAHGGAVESLLDEATAELGKMEFSPMLATIEIEFKITKAVPLHTTLRIDCQIQEVKGMRCWVGGSIASYPQGAVLCTCTAQLVDLQQLWAAKR